MPASILDAKARLESDGLRVVQSSDSALWIAAALRAAGDGIALSDDACALLGNAGRWVAVFPAEGLFTYEVPGSLSDLVSLIARVYDHYRRVGGPFKDAFTQAVNQPEHYLTGRSCVSSNGAPGAIAPAKAEVARPTR